MYHVHCTCLFYTLGVRSIHVPWELLCNSLLYCMFQYGYAVERSIFELLTYSNKISWPRDSDIATPSWFIGSPLHWKLENMWFTIHYLLPEAQHHSWSQMTQLGGVCCQTQRDWWTNALHPPRKWTSMVASPYIWLVNANAYNRAGHSKSVIEHRTSTVVGEHMVIKLFTQSAAWSIINIHMHNEQNNEVHKMDVGGNGKQWINLEWPNW